MAVVIALDAGTTGVRSIAFDHSGHVVGSRYVEFEQHFPRPGWVEHDADEIWRAVQHTLAELVAVARPARRGDRASPTSGRRRSSGTAEPVGPCTAPSCGRTGGPRGAATSCATLATSTSCAARPDSCWIPTSRPPSSSGC